MDTARFYFSFRSPYSWLAAERLAGIRAELELDISLIPARFSASRNFTDPVRNPRKFAYLLKDVARQCEAMGLEFSTPADIGSDFSRPSNAFLFAETRGRAWESLLATCRARWQRGADISDDAVLAEIAREIAIDPVDYLAAADDTAMSALRDERARHIDADGVFGVPFFVWRDEPFWGNDRLDWFLRAVRRSRAQAVPDLTADRFANPFR